MHLFLYIFPGHQQTAVVVSLSSNRTCLARFTLFPSYLHTIIFCWEQIIKWWRRNYIILLKWGREERREKYVDNQHDDEKCNRKRLMRHDKLFLTVTTKCHSRFPSSSLSRLLLKKIIEWNYASVYIKCEWQFVIQSIIFLRLLFFRELRIKNFLEKLLGFEFNN